MVIRRSWIRIDLSLLVVFTVWFARAVGNFSSRPLPAQVHLTLWQTIAGLVLCYAAPLLFWRPAMYMGRYPRSLFS